MKLTEYQKRTLEIVRDFPDLRTSEVGSCLFADEKENRKRNPSAQGMALAAGRFLGPLRDAKFVRQSIKGYWSITLEGEFAIGAK